MCTLFRQSECATSVSKKQSKRSAVLPNWPGALVSRNHPSQIGTACRLSGCSPSSPRPMSAGRSCGRISSATADIKPSMKSICRARRNMRCSPRCCRALPMLRCSRPCTRLKGDATPVGIGSYRACRGGIANQRRRLLNASILNLFIGLGRGELLPYGSYYLTGFLHERPLARLRDDLVKIGLERNAGNARAGRSRCDPVRDHVRSCEWPFPGSCRNGSDDFRKASRCHGSAVSLPISKMRKKRISTGGVGTLGRVFIEIEIESFALPV